MYLDPLGENDKKKKSILQSWKTFINRRFSAGLESSGPSKWKIETAPHCKQLDSVSCGVYVMKVGRSLLVLSVFVNPCITKTNTKYNLTRTFQRNDNTTKTLSEISIINTCSSNTIMQINL